MNKLLKLLSIGIFLSLFVQITPVNAVSFDTYRDKLYFDSEVIVDIDFRGSSEYLFFRITNLGDSEGQLNKHLVSMPFVRKAESTCKVTDSANSRFPLIPSGGEWMLRFPPEPVNWQSGETYYVLIFCSEVNSLQFIDNGFYILKIEAVKNVFNNDYFDKSHLIVKLPDDFWHDTELISASPQPQKMVNDNGRLLLEFSKDQITKGGKIIIPVIVVKKNIDWHLIINLVIVGLLTILSWNFIKKVPRYILKKIQQVKNRIVRA